jgi:hypothetical protein
VLEKHAAVLKARRRREIETVDARALDDELPAPDETEVEDAVGEDERRVVLRAQVTERTDLELDVPGLRDVRVGPVERAIRARARRDEKNGDTDDGACASQEYFVFSRRMTFVFERDSPTLVM